MDMYDIGVFAVLTAPFAGAVIIQEILIWTGLMTEEDFDWFSH